MLKKSPATDEVLARVLDPYIPFRLPISSVRYANHIPFDFGGSWIGLTTEEVTAPAVTLVQRLPVPITWAGVLAWVDS
jgi:hypothetical protein